MRVTTGEVYGLTGLVELMRRRTPDWRPLNVPEPTKPEVFGTAVRRGVLYRAYLTSRKVIIYVPSETRS